MTLTYIYHSGYAIESDNFIIVIDYYKDSSYDQSAGVVHSKILKSPKRLYMMCTHSHHDHFNPEILSWRQIRPDIVYIFSKDIFDNGMAKKDDAIYLDKFETYKDENLYIKAYGSTDIGVSFLIEADNKVIFHAGDLNNWHWNEEVSSEEADEAERYYLSELNLLANDVKHVDLAMFPVDPRLGKDYMRGAEQFVKKIKTGIFVPMHFGESYEKAAAFKEQAVKYGSKFFSWTHRGESIHF